MGMFANVQDKVRAGYAEFKANGPARVCAVAASFAGVEAVRRMTPDFVSTAIGNMWGMLPNITDLENAIVENVPLEHRESAAMVVNLFGAAVFMGFAVKTFHKGDALLPTRAMFVGNKKDV